MLPNDIHFVVARTSELGRNSTSFVNVDETSLKYLIYPLLALVANIFYKTISELRTEHLSQLRLIKALIHEIDVARNSWQNNKRGFTDAYKDGSPSGVLATRVLEDGAYFPYSVSTKSTTSVFAAEEIPAKSFGFLKSETMEKLVDFHDTATLLDSSIADMRDDVFRNLAPDRKLGAFGKLVQLFSQAEQRYQPCREALLGEYETYSSKSFTWFFLFPIRSGYYWLKIICLWIAANMLWHGFH